MFIRLILLLPFLRLMMILDVARMRDGSEDHPAEHSQDFNALDELATLHAQAILHLNRLNWPIGSLHNIIVGQRRVQGPFGRYEYQPVYEGHFGVSVTGGLILMRSGAIYGETGLLDPSLAGEELRRILADACTSVLDLEPAPVQL